MPDAYKLSVIIPCYNERATISSLVARVRAVAPDAEVLIIDDGSTDGTREVLPEVETTFGARVLLHDANGGKGKAIRTGLRAATGDILLIQDADLEYDPRDYPALLQPILEGNADVVYGSRFLGAPRRAMMFWHMIANKLLTLMTNILYDTILSDMETGYKVFKRHTIDGLTLRANRFDFEPEITAKILRRRYRIFEVPITFVPREYAEGKKIGLWDAFEAVWALLRYRFFD